MHIMHRVPLNTLWWMRYHTRRQSPCPQQKKKSKDQRPDYPNLLCFNVCFSKKVTAIFLGLLFCWRVVLFFGDLHDSLALTGLSE